MAIDPLAVAVATASVFFFKSPN
ncbi:uncharacterized protein G2W53_025593 [Senna tora]|uniref:Uncharacterized protein n=1 Tax=Senna tora TaxID=362788 RepID=A0A834TDF8_9FABA|nr:uncharacterized protein G2W53_025593 [Senna tora]